MTEINKTGMKRAALINDLSCIGNCSLSVGMPIMSCYGVETVALPTAVLSTHTTGFDGYVAHDMTAQMRAFSAHWKAMRVKFDCIYTGYFASLEQISFAEGFIRDFGGKDVLTVVDPVMGDEGALYDGFTPAHVAAMRCLCEKADVITPNYTEAAFLSGLTVDAGAEAMLAALKTPEVIITGVRRGDEVGYVARLDGKDMEFFRPWESAVLHGTGDVFTSAFCGELLQGATRRAAFIAAAELCDACIKETARRRGGFWYGLAFEEVLRRRFMRKQD